MNKIKREKLDLLLCEMLRVKNQFIKELWERCDFSSKFVNFKVDTWLSARLQQCLGKAASETVKSQRKRKKKVMPVCKSFSFDLDPRFCDFRFDENSFDTWVRLTCLGNKLQLRIPARKHKQFNKFLDWELKKSIKLQKVGNKYFVHFFFEKAEPEKKIEGFVIGIDTGYKKLVVSSEGLKYDSGMESVYEKISRKRQGSKAFRRALVERNNKINESLNKLSLASVQEVVAEDLRDVKRFSKGRIRKSFNNKLQRWSYPKVLDKLSRMCEEGGVLFTKVNPAYTSQRCSSCGVIDKINRKGEVYQCTCGLVIDADLNAAINISHMGVYSPHAKETEHNGIEVSYYGK